LLESCLKRRYLAVYMKPCRDVLLIEALGGVVEQLFGK